MRARWYDPATGRLLMRDPLRGEPQAPTSLNAYLYANANPIRLTDPSGYCAPNPIIAFLCQIAQLAQRIGPAIQRLLPWAQRAESAAERLSAAEAQVLTRLAEVENAAALGGSRVVQAASRTEADEVAARWVGENAVPLLERETGRAVGMVNWATGRVARFAEYDQRSGWHMNLEQLREDAAGWWSGSSANVHVTFPGW